MTHPWASYLPNPEGNFADRQSSNPAGEPDRELWEEWRRLVNMTERQLSAFLDEYGDEAGLSRSEAKAEGVRSGRDSAQALLRMIPTGTSYARAEENWGPAGWKWAKRQVGFIKRMRGVKGPLYEDDGEPTRKLLALKLWGHDPEKPCASQRPRFLVHIRDLASLGRGAASSAMARGPARPLVDSRGPDRGRESRYAGVSAPNLSLAFHCVRASDGVVRALCGPRTASCVRAA